MIDINNGNWWKWQHIRCKIVSLHAGCHVKLQDS